MSDDGKWAHLPKELLQLIGEHLDSRIDVYRFRSVCTSWRFSVSPSHKNSPLISIKIPPPVLAEALLTPVTFCRLEFSNSDNSSSSDSSSMACLTKVELSTDGDLQLLSSLSNRQIRLSPGTFPKMMNLLNFRLVELFKGYYLKLSSGRPVLGINKVVPFPNSGEIMILAIFHEGKLGYLRNGDENWTLLDDTNFHYDDIVVHKGQFYVVDRCGIISWIDSSLNLIQFYPALYGCGDRKNLVECCGDLYIVDRYFDGERRKWEDIEGEWNRRHRFRGGRNLPKCRTKTVDVKVYKLDGEWGRWVDVRSLEDRIIVLGNECCFSVCVKEFGDCEGNCIYFTDPYDEDFAGEISGFDARVFKLSDRSIGKASNFNGFSQILWPHLPS